MNTNVKGLKASWLFVPMLENKFLEKTNKLNADIFIFDLEDSIFKTKKKLARKSLSKIISNFNLDNVALRINHLSSEWGKDDLLMALKLCIKNIVYPKVSSSADLSILYDFLTKNDRNNIPEIIPIIETLDGEKNAEEIIGCNKINYVIFGSEDYLADCGIFYRDYIQRNPILNQVITKLSILTSKYNKFLIDCANPNFYSDNELELFLEECLYTSNLGAVGKLAIHPNQLTYINNVYKEKEIFHDEFWENCIYIIKKMILEEKTAIRYKNHLIGLTEIKKYQKIFDKYSLVLSKNIRVFDELKLLFEEIL